MECNKIQSLEYFQVVNGLKASVQEFHPRSFQLLQHFVQLKNNQSLFVELHVLHIATSYVFGQRNSGNGIHGLFEQRNIDKETFVI
jgi:hypothetical protein